MLNSLAYSHGMPVLQNIFRAESKHLAIVSSLPKPTPFWFLRWAFDNAPPPPGLYVFPIKRVPCVALSWVSLPASPIRMSALVQHLSTDIHHHGDRCLDPYSIVIATLPSLFEQLRANSHIVSGYMPHVHPFKLKSSPWCTLIRHSNSCLSL